NGHGNYTVFSASEDISERDFFWFVKKRGCNRNCESYYNNPSVTIPNHVSNVDVSLFYRDSNLFKIVSLDDIELSPLNSSDDLPFDEDWVLIENQRLSNIQRTDSFDVGPVQISWREHYLEMYYYEVTPFTEYTLNLDSLRIPECLSVSFYPSVAHYPNSPTETHPFSTEQFSLNLEKGEVFHLSLMMSNSEQSKRVVLCFKAKECEAYEGTSFNNQFLNEDQSYEYLRGELEVEHHVAGSEDYLFYSYFKEPYVIRDSTIAQSYTSNYLKQSRAGFQYRVNVYDTLDQCYSVKDLKGRSILGYCGISPVFQINGEKKSILFPNSNVIHSCIGDDIIISLDASSDYTIDSYTFYDENDDVLNATAAYNYITDELKILSTKKLRKAVIRLIRGYCDLEVVFDINPSYCHPPTSLCDFEFFPNPLSGSFLDVEHLTFDKGKTFSNIYQVEIFNPYQGVIYQDKPNAKDFRIRNIDSFIKTSGFYMLSVKDDQGRECSKYLVK
ncbi:MAG: hypothetical protein MRY83_24055, partial [Flavobacteriales bacterium]|nr:hypothetical protein [Flavobacteriales bacterium]